jgi:hypothetical protein
MQDNDFEAGVQEAMQLLRTQGSNQQPAQQPTENDDPEFEAGVQEAMEVLKKQNSANIPAQNGQNSEVLNNQGILSKIGSETKGVALNFLKEFMKGGGSLLDLATEITQGGAPDDSISFAPGGSVDPITGEKDIFARREELGDFIKQHNSQKPKFNFGVAKKHGEVLDTIAGEEVKPESSLQKASGTAGGWASGALLGGPAGFLKNAGIGAGMGAVSGGLQEAGVPQLGADLASLAGFLTVAGAPKLAKIFKNSASLSDAEKRVANYLKQTMGEEAVTAVSENINSTPKYPVTGYEPTTAEVANNPLASQLHRLREGIPTSGLSERAGSQNNAISGVAEKLSLDKASSREVKDVVGEELAKRQTKRTSETTPLYEELRTEQTQISPTNINEFLENNRIVKGKKKRDLENIKELIKPTRKLTTKEEEILKKYESERNFILSSDHGADAKERLLSRLKKPKENNPTVADLDEARQNINDEIEALTKSGQNNRVQQLIKARDALDKDLSVFPKQAEITAKYAELSKPVNEILEHPTLRKLPESRLNDIFSSMYDSKSYDNVSSLKNVLKNRPQEWKGFQDASVDHLMKSIKNSGVEGKGNVLSYQKLNKFLEKHEKALQEVFTEDQMKFLEELKNSLQGRNVAQTLGLEKGSQTYGKFITGTHINEGFGSKISRGLDVAHALPITKVGKFAVDSLRVRLGNYMKTKEADVMTVLDNFLKDPEYAHKLLNHKFKNQMEFNKEMNILSKQGTSIISKKESDKNK